MVYKFFDRRSATDTGTGINFEHQNLVEDLHKPIIEKTEKKTKYTCLLKTKFRVQIEKHALVVL